MYKKRPCGTFLLCRLKWIDDGEKKNIHFLILKIRGKFYKAISLYLFEILSDLGQNSTNMLLICIQYIKCQEFIIKEV